MSEHRDKRNFYLIGMPGSGKSTIGKGLARALGVEFIDADEEMVRATGVPITTIFEIEGESGFRHRESQLILKLTQRQGILLSTGGGAVLATGNRDRLRKTGFVIYLHASLDQLWSRTRRDARRPLLRCADPRSVLKAMLEAREPLYREIADMVVETGRQGVGKLVADIANRVARDAGGAESLPAKEEGERDGGH